MTEDDDELLTVNEIAKRLKVNQQTVYNWIDRGSLHAVRVGSRRVRVTPSDLDAFLNPGARPESPAPDLAAESWQGFSAAMANAVATLATGERNAIADALREVARTAQTLADTIAPKPDSPTDASS